MKNQKLLIWGSFFGAIALVLIIAGVFYLKGANRMLELEEIFADWKSVSGQVTKFEARFPDDPEYAAQDLPIPDSDQFMKQEIFVGGGDEISYFVSAVLYPSEVTGNEEENLRRALEGVRNIIPGGEVVFSEFKVPFLGKNYLEYKIHSTQNNTSYKGRMVLSAKALYQAYVSYQEAAYNDDAYTYFVNSFQIK